MRRTRRKADSFWPGILHHLGIPAVAFLALLIGARLALPYVVRYFVNKQLSQLQGFHGRVEKIRVNLYRGAYTIINLRLSKTSGRVPVPFITMAKMDLSVEWQKLLKGALVGKVTVDQPQVNFVAGPTEAQKQAGFHKDWKQTLQNITPFTINRFQVNNGTIRFLDPYRQPPVNIYITNLFATATNLTNVRNEARFLPAGLVARARTIGNGQLGMELHMNPLASAPTFKLKASITNMDLTALNDFLRSYAKFSVVSGSFSLFVNVAAADERYQGYAKPFLLHMAVLSPEKEAHENVFHVMWDFVVAAISRIFRNQPHNQVATVVPISGVFQKGTSVDLWGTIGGILQNAFVQALSPHFVRTVPLPGPAPTGSGPAP